MMLSKWLSLNNPYPLKLWIATVIIGPLPFCILSVPHIYKLPELYIIIFAFGVIFSLPVFALHVVAFNLLLKTKLSSYQVKLVLDAGAIAAIFAILMWLEDFEGIYMALPYSLCLVVADLFMKLQKQHKPAP